MTAAGHTPKTASQIAAIARSELERRLVEFERLQFDVVPALRAERDRLKEQNAAMLEALKAAQTALEWTGDDKNSAGCMADRQRAYTAIRAAIAAAETEAGNG